MFWNRKKDSAKRTGAPPAPPKPEGAPYDAPAAPARQAGSGGASGSPSTIQFLTGDSDLDRRSVEVLLEAIARVSEARNIDELLVDIVDRSIEIAGAERGLLILADKDLDRSQSGEQGLSLRV